MTRNVTEEAPEGAAARPLDASAPFGTPRKTPKGVVNVDQEHVRVDHDTGSLPDPRSRETTTLAATKGSKSAPASITMRRSLAMLFCALMIVAIAAAVAFGISWANLDAKANTRAAVKETASRFLVDLTNFDASNVDEEFSKVLAFSTGAFAHQARAFFDGKIRQELEKAGASSRGQIRDLFVQSVSANHASVFGVVDQTYANDASKGANADVLRVVLGLTSTPAGWRISEVTVLSAGSSAGAI